MILSPFFVSVTASLAVATTTAQSTATVSGSISSSTSTSSSTATATGSSTLPPSTTTEEVLDNAIVITKIWNGTDLENEKDHVVLRFTNTDENELQIEFEAAFYNSPIPSQPMIEVCPERPFNGLYNYEVVEVFFLNDDEQYLEVEVSPRGRYLLLLLDGERNTLLQALPVFPDGVTDLENPCLDEANGCDQRWSGKLTIPQEYMPPNVTKMNAYAIRGEDYGVPFVSDDSKTYLAFYENTETESPDFHHLDSFGNVPDAVTADGYAFPKEFSNLWSTARRPMNQPFHFLYEVVYPADCESFTSSEDYSCADFWHLLNKDDQHGVLRVVINVTDSEYVAPIVRDDLMTLDSESVWLTFTNDNKNEVRIGVSPSGDAIVQFVHDEEWLNSDVDITNEMTVNCITPSPDERPSNYWCLVNIHTDLLPANVTYSQIIHVHRPLKNNPTTDIEVDLREYEFIGAVCPGNPEGNGNFDFRGCGTDNKLFVDPLTNSNYSMIWEDALSSAQTISISSSLLAPLLVMYSFQIL